MRSVRSHLYPSQLCVCVRAPAFELSEVIFVLNVNQYSLIQTSIDLVSAIFSSVYFSQLRGKETIEERERLESGREGYKTFWKLP